MCRQTQHSDRFEQPHKFWTCRCQPRVVDVADSIRTIFRPWSLIENTRLMLSHATLQTHHRKRTDLPCYSHQHGMIRSQTQPGHRTNCPGKRRSQNQTRDPENNIDPGTAGLPCAGFGRHVQMTRRNRLDVKRQCPGFSGSKTVGSLGAKIPLAISSRPITPRRRSISSHSGNAST